MSVLCPTVTGQAPNKIAKLIQQALTTRMVSHSTSYCISSVVTYQLNQSLAWQTTTV